MAIQWANTERAGGINHPQRIDGLDSMIVEAAKQEQPNRPDKLRADWRRLFSLFAIFLTQPLVAAGQIGLSARDLESQPGITRTYSRSNQSQYKRYKSQGTPAEPATKIYLVLQDRVGGVSFTWPGELAWEQALTQLNHVTGLPELKQSPKKPAWKIETRQAEALPPLGAWESRPVRVPIFSAVTGARAQWTEYYTKWGQFVGSSPVRVEPIVTTYSRYAGSFTYSVSKFAVPLVRSDGAAYAWLELSDYSHHGGFATNRLFIAEPDVYWRSQLDDIREERMRFEHSVTSSSPHQKSLDRLRPYDLKVTELYHRVLMDNVPQEVAAMILDLWELNAVVGAVDDPEIPLSTVQELASGCPSKRLCPALLDGIKKCPVQSSLRRAEMLNLSGTLLWVPPLADLLKQKNKRSKVVITMCTLAAKNGASELELDSLGTDPARWERWYKDQIQQKKK